MAKRKARKSVKSNRELARARRLSAIFNITPEEYDKVLKFQGGVCAITKLPTKKLVLDHDHKNGKLRGLLDWRINRALEVFKDNPEWLRRAADYLENPTVEQALGEVVYGVVGSVSRKAKNRRYGPNGSKTPSPRRK